MKVEEHSSLRPKIHWGSQSIALPLIFSFLILISPSNLLGLLLGLYFARVVGSSRIKFAPFVLSTSLFFASLNSTKILESDLYAYFLASETLVNAKFGEFLSLHGHEPGYYFFNWIYVRLLVFNWNSWVFVFSFVFYALWLLGLLRLLHFFKLDRTSTIAVLAFAAFSPLVFVQSAHLVRQFLATSIGLLGIATFLTTGRGWRYFIAAPLFHVVALIFLIVPIATFVSGKSAKIAGFTTIVGLILLVFGGREIGQNPSILEALPLPEILSYGIRRLSQAQFYELAVIDHLALFFCVISLGVGLFFLSAGTVKESAMSQKTLTRISSFLAFNVILSTSVIIFAAAEKFEPATRIFQVVLLQFPFILTLRIWVSLSIRKITIAISMLMPIVFFLYPSSWTYRSSLEVLLFPHYYFLFAN